MATTVNAVSITASLGLSITNPSIGGNSSSTQAYTDGDKAQDTILVLTSTPTALNASIGGTGFMFISNPGPLDVAILVGVTALGIIPAPAAGRGATPALLPLSSGVIINATCASAQNVGVSVVKTSINI
jgi:hypothetical protein